MPTSGTERIAYFNGKFVPEKDVLIPFRDLGIVRGDGCFDMARTFNGELFKLREHADRLYASLAYLGIDTGLAREEMIDISHEVLRRNRSLLKDSEDYWVAQRITRGIDADSDVGWEHHGPTVVVECKPIPFKSQAKLMRSGIRLQVSSVRRTPPECLSPHAKLNNYQNHIMADRDVHRTDPEAKALFLDINGNIAEGTNSSFFMVKDGVLLTCGDDYILLGITRQTVLELAEHADIEVRKADITVEQAEDADEMFLTFTSMCICPVSRFNGHAVGDGSFPGPVTDRLMKAFSALVRIDYVAQYLRHLED